MNEDVKRVLDEKDGGARTAWIILKNGESLEVCANVFSKDKTIYIKPDFEDKSTFTELDIVGVTEDKKGLYISVGEEKLKLVWEETNK